MRTVKIEEQERIEKIISSCKTCFLGLADANGQPYVVPMNFGYKDNVIYLHSGQEGRKWQIMKENPKACITFNLGEEIKWQDEHMACSYRVASESIIAEGELEFVEDFDEKVEILDILMGQYSDRKFKYGKPAVNNVGVMKLKIDQLGAKEFGAKAETPWNQKGNK